MPGGMQAEMAVSGRFCQFVDMVLANNILAEEILALKKDYCSANCE